MADSATEARPTVGLLGTGRMGSAMARAIARRGLPLVLWNRTPDRAAALAAELGEGVTFAATPAEVAASAAICFSMVADETAVDQLYRGPDGLLAGAGPSTVLVDSSTVPPRVIQSLAPEIRATGAGVLDAPVSGSVALATAGELTLMVGGSAADLERARPALEAISRTIFHLGPVGAGAAMKLAVNTLIFGINGCLAEGLILAEKAGIERSLAYDVIAASAAGSPFVQYKRAAFLDPEGTPPAFALELAAKDLRLIGDLAADHGVAVPQAEINLHVVEAASASRGADRDFSYVAVHLRGDPTD